MTTLTETAYATRNLIKYGTITLVVLIILRFVAGGIINYVRSVRPTPPPPPTVGFGKLPKINFPEKKDLPTLEYRLETIQGVLPKVDTVAKAYVSVKPGASLLSLDRAKETAGKMGFILPPQSLSSTLYRFATESTPKTTLEYDIVMGNFKLWYDYQNDQTIVVEKKLPTNEQAVAEAKSFLQAVGLFAPDLVNGRNQISYFRYSVPYLIPVISLSEADFVRVGLLKEDLNNFQILSENPKKAPISFLFSGARDRTRRIIEIDYNYNNIDREGYETYPLKTTTDAWQELLGGKGYIANLGDNTAGKIIIRRIYLAYFDSTEPQNFLQPVFVFEGDKDFIAYVPAVDTKWIE